MSIQNDVYDKIKTAIIYGELSPGEKLSEIGLANRMNASRTPIREAIRRLQMEGYVSVSPNKGAYVSKLPAKEIEEIYDVIGLLEGYAAELAAQKIENSDLNKLKKLQKNLVACASKKKFRDYIKENTELHHLITRLSGNNSLAKTITELRMRIYRYRLVSVTIPGYLEKYAADHDRIINSIAKRDSVRARENMKNHVKFVKEILVGFLNENPGF
ncbi:MAG: GntR family transcriptional regulator [Deltaproteobacteria bacterium]